MSNTARVSARVPRGIRIALLVGFGLALLPVGFLAYVLLWTDVWEGDVPAVVRHVDPYGMSVELSLPPGALRQRPIEGGTVRERLDGVMVGEPLTCHVRQTYQSTRDLGYGPRTEIQRCRR